MARAARLFGVLALVYALVRVPTEADATAGGMAFLQFNMCGEICGTRFGVVADLEREITGHRPQPFVLTLQEVCRSQYDELVANLPYHGHFEPTIPGRCWDGSDYGIAVLVRTSDVEHLGSWPLPNPAGGELRMLVCVRTTALVACGTHIDTTPANKASQVAAVASRAGSYRAGGPVVVGGDFNVTPDNAVIKPMYDLFVEADAADGEFTGGCSSARCGDRDGYSRPTRKIDYLFLSRSGFAGISADATSAPRSDHIPLWATADPSRSPAA
jgi:endonuclease/exonuclease/phosphatase family metal-dependent hydrolase